MNDKRVPTHSMHTHPDVHPDQEGSSMQKQAVILYSRRRWRTAWALLFTAVVLLMPQKSQAATNSVLGNGSFEQGFTVMPGCTKSGKDSESNVGTGWNCFSNKGA